MNALGPTRPILEALGHLPWTAELYQRWRGPERPPEGGFRLDRIASALPAWTEAVGRFRSSAKPVAGKRVLLFAYLSWWIEHAVLLGLLLTAVGHDVQLVFLPFRRWTTDPSRFNLRRQRAYLRERLGSALGLMAIGDLYAGGGGAISPELDRALEHQTRLDLQYTLQREDVDPEGDPEARGLYELRKRRNRAAARGILGWIRRRAPEVVIVPNGSILEFGAVYHSARTVGIPAVTYEFGEQRERLWLSQNAQVMKQDTRALWQARASEPLTGEEQARLQSLFSARKLGSRWENFSRSWQQGETAGASDVRQHLGLDSDRPVVLICTNVVGDSLALDRQVFSAGMSDWLAKSVRHLAARSDVQVVVRVHPGELLGAGHASQDIVRGSLPEMPRHVHVVPPGDAVNTYDLIDLCHLGVVYTTTVGLEMAMAGTPVVVAGETHYRGKGFTYDPATWDEYEQTLDRLVSRPKHERLPESQVELARRYAYRFFFEYPMPYPWHLIGFWDDVGVRPVEKVLESGLAREYRRTLGALVGDPFSWGVPD